MEDPVDDDDDDDDDDGGGGGGGPIPPPVTSRVVKGPSAEIVCSGAGVKGRSENNPDVGRGVTSTTGSGGITFKPASGYKEVEILLIDNVAYLVEGVV